MIPLASLALRLRRCGRGAGAVEFALIAPVLILLLLGGSELGVALTVSRKMEAAVGDAVDLVSQSPVLSEDDLRKAYGIARASVAPYPLAPMRLRVDQIRIDDKGKALVDWSCPSQGYARLATGTPVTLPDRFSALRNVYLLRGQGEYDFNPVTGMVFDGSATLSSKTYVQPRYSARIDAPGCAAFAM